MGLWSFWGFLGVAFFGPQKERKRNKEMSVSSRYNKADAWVSKKFQDTDTSPERTKKWIEPQMKMEGKVPVVYYLSRNGHLEHPHFMEVPLSSPGGLFLRGKRKLHGSFFPEIFLSVLFLFRFYSPCFDICWFWLRWFSSDWWFFAAIFSRCDRQIESSAGSGHGQHVLLVFKKACEYSQTSALWMSYSSVTFK